MVAVGDSGTADFANSRPRVFTGTATPTVTTAGTAGFVDVSFPAGFFPAGATVAQVTVVGTTSPQTFAVSYANLTATGMRIYGSRTSGTGGVPVAYSVFGPES